MSFSTNNISIPGSSAVDGSTVVQLSSHHDPIQLGGSSATSLPTSQTNQTPLSIGRRASDSFFKDPNKLTQSRKKSRLDSKQDAAQHQQILRPWLKRQEMLQQQQQQSSDQYNQILLQVQNLRQQQQYLQSLTPLQRFQLKQLQRQQQLQQQLQQQQQQQGMQLQLSGGPLPYENSVCARRLMQYLYHQRERPSVSSIDYWRNFVREYYSPGAKKRLCLSHYDSVGHSSPTTVLPLAANEEWQCDLCGSKSGRGYEATFDVLPRHNEIKFTSVLDELLYLNMPSERRFASGVMVLEYEKAVQESVYEHSRVVHEGPLRIIFSQELKILSWEFCIRKHEELVSRRVVASHVNQLLQVAEKCQSTINQSGPDGIHQQDLQANSNMAMAAARQLANSLESPSLNDFGFSKQYGQSLQISEVANSMKDMIDLSCDQKVGPIETLKSYQNQKKTDKMQLEEMELANAMIRSNKLMAMRNSEMNNTGGGQGSQTMLGKQNHLNSGPDNVTIQQEPTGNRIPSPSCDNSIQQEPTCGNSNQTLEQQMIDQQMANSNGGSGQQEESISGQNMNCNSNIGSNIPPDYGVRAETPSQNQEGNTSIIFDEDWDYLVEFKEELVCFKDL